MVNPGAVLTPWTESVAAALTMFMVREHLSTCHFLCLVCFHCLSVCFHCLSVCFHCRPVPIHGAPLSTARSRDGKRDLRHPLRSVGPFHCLSLTLHCLSNAFRHLSPMARDLRTSPPAALTGHSRTTTPMLHPRQRVLHQTRKLKALPAAQATRTRRAGSL